MNSLNETINFLKISLSLGFKKFLIIIFAMMTQIAVSQNSYVVIEAQYDSWGPSESQFYITDAQGDTVYHHQPTVQSEYLLDTLWVNAQPLTVIL